MFRLVLFKDYSCFYCCFCRYYTTERTYMCLHWNIKMHYNLKYMLTWPGQWGLLEKKSKTLHATKRCGRKRTWFLAVLFIYLLSWWWIMINLLFSCADTHSVQAAEMTLTFSSWHFHTNCHFAVLPCMMSCSVDACMLRFNFIYPATEILNCNSFLLFLKWCTLSL